MQKNLIFITKVKIQTTQYHQKSRLYKAKIEVIVAYVCKLKFKKNVCVASNQERILYSRRSSRKKD